MALNNAIDGFFRDFAREFIRNRANDIRARNLTNTNALLNSLYAKVLNEPSQGVFLVLIFARTYGRYQDMRRKYTKAGGDEMIKSLEEWVGAEGVEKFKRGKYAERLRDLPPQKVQNAVAWGIARKLTRVPGTRKRSWWNKGKTRDIENFYDTLLRLCQDAVAQELKTTL